MSGAPVFTGTRVPVQTLVEYLVAGDSLNDFLQDFPSVSYQHAVAVLEVPKSEFVTTGIPKSENVKEGSK